MKPSTSASPMLLPVRARPVDVAVHCWAPRPYSYPGESWGKDWAVGVRVSVRLRVGHRTVKTRLADRKVIFRGQAPPTTEEALIEARQIAEAGRVELSRSLGLDLIIAPFDRWTVDTAEWTTAEAPEWA